jgi:TatD DNase family protein
MLTDIHVHLDRYKSSERPLVLQRAAGAGVRWMVTAGMDLQSSAAAVDIAGATAGVLASVGLHPWVAAEAFPADFQEEIADLARHDVTVAVGEVGLDFIDNVFTGVTYHDNPDLRRAQEQAFRKQVEVACALGLPLITHCRGAYPALLRILKEERAQRVGGVIHNFDADDRVGKQLLDMGFLLSFGGAVTYPSATALQEVARRIPLEGIITETDSPYMPLYRQPTESNEPANVAKVAQRLATLRGMDMAELVDAVYRNFVNVLHIEERRELKTRDV